MDTECGLLVRPGTLELIDQAMRLGADVAGDVDPCGIDRDLKGHLDAVFALADRHTAPVDIHLHEPGEMGAFSMELIIERTLALDLQGSVMISHAFCLGSPDAMLVEPLLTALAKARISIITTGAPSRPIPPSSASRWPAWCVAPGPTGSAIPEAPAATMTC